MTRFEYPVPPAAPRRWPWVVVLVLLLVLQGLLWGWRQEQYRLYTTTGLRFSQPIPEELLQQVLEPEGGKTDNTGISASFWGQQLDTVRARSNRQAEEVFCIGYWGDARDCLPVHYQAGTAPGVLGKECALSTALAETLFGSTDVVGLTITWQGKSYVICGIFSAADPVLLAPSRKNLSAAELHGISIDSPRADVEQWCQTVGLPAPHAILYGPQRCWIADCLCWIPLCFIGTVWLGCFFRLSLTWSGAVRGIAWFILALLFALLLPFLLQSLPGWLIPARWSDFSFWETLGQHIGQSRQAWAEIPRFWRDYTHL